MGGETGRRKEREISEVPLPLPNTPKERISGEVKTCEGSQSFPNCGSGLIPPGPWLSTGLWLQTAVRLFLWNIPKVSAEQ